MKYTIEFDEIEYITIVVETELIPDVEEAHKKIEDEIKWLLKTKKKLEPTSYKA